MSEKGKEPSTPKARPSENTQDSTSSKAAVFHDLSSAPSSFVVAGRHSADAAAVQMLRDNGSGFVQQLKDYSGIELEVIDSYRSSSGPNAGTFAAGGTSAETLLVRVDEAKGSLLQRQSEQQRGPIIFEKNLRFIPFSDAQLMNALPPTPAFYAGDSGTLTIQFEIIGEGDEALGGASVTVYAGMWRTYFADSDGRVTLSLSGQEMGALQGLAFEAKSGHWNRLVRNPQLASGEKYRIKLQSFSEFDPRFTKSRYTSWGSERVNLDRGLELKGAGVKVGVIDSGCDATHALLQHVKSGLNTMSGADPNQWQDDDSGHGTHCVGVIGARATEELSFQGLAPEADIHIYKVFPDGSFFTIGAAVEAAIQDEVDVLNLSLGSTSFSDFLADSLEKARQAGIVCVVAAGNSGTDVMFPANLSSVIAVTAVGRLEKLPADSLSAQKYRPDMVTPDGYFSPTFTCFGPSVDFTAPGVGIISTVPGNGLKAMDGTSMAAPHIAGLCALYLAHDPVLSSIPKGPARVELLVERLRENSLGLPLHTARVGSGMPLYLGTQGRATPVTLRANLGAQFGGVSLRF